MDFDAHTQRHLTAVNGIQDQLNQTINNQY